MASTNNPNATNMPIQEMKELKTKDGKPQGATLITTPPTEVPVGQEVRYVAVLKLNYPHEDFDIEGDMFYVAHAELVNEVTGVRSRLVLKPTSVAYEVELPGGKAWCLIYPRLVFPEEGKFHLYFNLHTYPQGLKAGRVDIGTITVKKMEAGKGLRDSPKDYSKFSDK